MHVSIASNNPTPFEERPPSEYINYIAPIKKAYRYPFALDRLHDNSSLVVFPAELVMVTSLNGWPQFIEYELVPSKRTSSGYLLTSARNKKILSSIVGASFVNYYSACEDKAQTLYGKQIDNWPAIWRFAWVVRNGFAHGGKININDQKLRPANWKLWSLDYNDNGRGILFDHGMMGVGDLIALMGDLDLCLRDN